jgi:hypothetical protein
MEEESGRFSTLHALLRKETDGVIKREAALRGHSLFPCPQAIIQVSPRGILY